MFKSLHNWFRPRKVSGPVCPPLPAAPAAPDWLAEYQSSWAIFLNSPAGLALMLRFRAVEALVATNACKAELHSEHRAGTANGWQECRAWLESLSRCSRVNEPSGHEETLANFDMPAPGEAPLHELLSP